MVTIPQVAEAMQTVLNETARQAGQRSGFVQRPGKLDGASWTQTLVFGWLADPQATLEALAQTAALLGVAITPQGLDERFSQAAAECVRGVLEAGLQQLLAAEPAVLPLLQRFNGVYLQDSTQIALPAELATVWRGNGGKDSGAALKLQVQWNWLSGQLVRVDLQDGRAADGAAAAQAAPLPAGALRLADLGYFNLDVLAATAQQQAFFLTHWKVGTRLFSAQAEPLDLLAELQRQPGAEVEVAVQVGQQHRLPARLIALRVPAAVAADRRRRLRRAAQEKGQTVSAERLALAAWTLLLTNIPPDQLTAAEVQIVAACRWQIELLFKLWKSHGRLDESRSTNVWRQLTEIYAKLLSLLVQHWLWLLSCWSHPNRSLMKAAQTVQKFAWFLAAALTCPAELRLTLQQIQRTLAVGCRTNSRRQTPATFQTLLTGAGLPGGSQA
jgi:hypothetical protein